MASNIIEEETSITPAINMNTSFPSPSSSLSSNSSIHFSILNEAEKISPPNIPLPPPMPATLVHLAVKLSKQPDSQTSTTNLPLSSSIKSSSSTTNVPSQSTSATTKRTPSKTSVFSKIFK
jgi:hypothetical protein